MNAAVQAWIQHSFPPPEVTGRDVLEVGSGDVNGSVRGWFVGNDCRSYMGLDAWPGLGVDRVIRCEELLVESWRDHADIVVSTEMLEHVWDWATCLHALMHVTRPGGILAITTRSPGFPYHPYPEDHWRFTVQGLGWAFAVAGFSAYQAQPDPSEPGVFIQGQKPVGWQWPGQAPADLWASAGVTEVVRP